MNHQSNCCDAALTNLSINGKGSCMSCGRESNPVMDLRHPFRLNPFYLLLFILLSRIRYNNLISIIY